MQKEYVNTIDKYETGVRLEKLYSVTDFFCKLLDAAKDSKLSSLSALLSSAEESLPVIKFLLKFLSKIIIPQDKNEQCFLVCSLAYRHAFSSTVKSNPDILMNVSEEKIKQIQEQLRNYKWHDIQADTFSLSTVLSTSFVKEADEILISLFKNLGVKEQDTVKFLNNMHIYFLRALTEIFTEKQTAEKFQNLINYTKDRPAELTSKIILKEFADYQSWLFTHCPLYMEKDFALKDIYVQPKCIIKSQNQRKFSDVLKDNILKYLGDDKFNAFISINGSAGAGKSSFTLSLCSELTKMDLIPIRIPFKQIKFDTGKRYFSDTEIYSILEKAISFRNETRYGEFHPQVPKNLFCDGDIFNERIAFRKTYISPYVLILDGWDELNSDIQERMHSFLKGLHDTFINNRNNKIRVILTGRPNSTLELFWKDVHALELTIKDFNNDELLELINKLDYFKPLHKEYKNTLIEKFRERQGFDILKSPLIVYILHELLTDAKGLDIDKLFNNKAMLYKTLADITCENAGKKKLDKDGKFDTKLYGENLRDVLKNTAAVISIKGEELVTYDDLKQILDDKELAITEDEASKALVSYYFKGGNYNAGCEFIHKSFREYFFAELIFDLIKQEKSETAIIKLLSTNYLKDEEIAFLEGMIENSISDPYKKDNDFIQFVRNNLLRLWRLWIDQRHMHYKKGVLPISSTLNNVLKLIESDFLTPDDLNATLGVNILLLNIMFNKIVLIKCGITTLKDVQIIQTQNFLVKFKPPMNNMTFTAFAPFEKKSLSWRDISYLVQLLNHNNEIPIDFKHCYFSEICFHSINMPLFIFQNCYLKKVMFTSCGLNLTTFIDSFFNDCEFYQCNLSETSFNHCEMHRPIFIQTDLSLSTFEELCMDNAKFQNTSAEEIKINSCDMRLSTIEYSNFKDAEIETSNFSGSKIKNSNFFKAKISLRSFLNDVEFSYTDLKQAEFYNTQCINTKFKFCNLQKTRFVEIDKELISFENCSE